MPETSSPSQPADPKAELRNDIRTLLDKLEGTFHAGKTLKLTPQECAEAAYLLRRIQDAAAQDLGYEPAGLMTGPGFR